jgi:large repetitive protein
MNLFPKSRLRWLLIVPVVFGFVLIAVAAASSPVYSAPQGVTRYVSVDGDNLSNDCIDPARKCNTIGYAVGVANSGDTISIGSGTYYDNIEINGKSLTLQGQGAATTIVDGDNRAAVLKIWKGNNPNVTVSGLTLRKGSAGDDFGGGVRIDSDTYVTILNTNIINNTANYGGGGIYNSGFLTLVNVLLRDNRGGIGGGLANYNSADLNNVAIYGNTATNIEGGGGIYNFNTLKMTNSFVGNMIPANQNKSTGGVGGGISNVFNGKATLTNSSVVGNQANVGDGGGIYNTAILIATNAVITGNVTAASGGGIFNAGTAIIDDVILNSNQANDGGGIFDDQVGYLTIDDSTISNNSSVGTQQGGGGINSQGTLTLTQSAVTANFASAARGGGLYVAGPAQLNNVTLSGNTANLGGGAIWNTGNNLKITYSTIYTNSAPSLRNNTGVTSTVVISNSILARASNNTVNNICSGGITSQGHNIDQGHSCALAGTGDLSDKDPALKPLQDNGGPTPTHAIDFFSPARDSIGSCAAYVDQRNITRPQAAGCDRGAYEVVGNSATPTLDFSGSACVASSFTISENLAIGQILVGANIDATNRAQLAITLISPALRQVKLLNTGQSSGTNVDILFDDSGVPLPANENQPPDAFPYNYVRRPYTPLSSLIGVPARGLWTLQVCSSGATGVFNNWAIFIPELTNFKVMLPLIRR